MARESMITRTIKTTDVKALAVNDNDELETVNLTLPRTYESDADALKAAKNFFDRDGLTIVKVRIENVNENLYGMPEADFVKAARKIK